MNMFNTLAQFSQIAMGSFILGMGTLIIIPDSQAQPDIITDPKPLETYTGTLQDLEGTQSRNMSAGVGVGGEDPTYVNVPSLETDKDALEAKTEALDAILEDHDYNLGDVKRPTYRVPVINF